jgi:DNA-binding response OmpR family regulator
MVGGKNMLDPRKPKTLRPRTLSVLVVDAANFSRGMIAEILRGHDVANIFSARGAADAQDFLSDNTIDLIFLSWEPGDAFDALSFCRALRRAPGDRLRRLPVILVTSALTRQMVIDGRDAGVDEFLAKPISPAALRQRLEMVIETPRPFVDCDVFIGPCRRRKNPADYYGEKRRAGDNVAAASGPLVDHDEEAAKTPIRIALAALRETCNQLPARPTVLGQAIGQIKVASDIALASKDSALHGSLSAFEAYIGVSSPLGQLDESVMNTALSALEQLAMLPLSYADARDSVALALGKAIQKKLAA